MRTRRGPSSVEVQGIKRYRAGGRWYCYHRATGTRLKATFGSAEFFEELAAAEAKLKEKPKAKRGTLGDAIERYQASPAFLELAPRTRSDYLKVFDYLAKLDGMPLTTLTRPFIAELRDKTFKKRKRRFANYVVSVLGSVCAFAAERGMIDENPAKGVKAIRRPKGMAKANRAWSAAERAAVMEAAPAHLRLPIGLGMLAGLREGDVVRLPRNVVKDGWLTWRTGKAGVVVDWPVLEPLQRLLDETPAHDAITLCVNSRGLPWTQSGFRASFFKLVRRLEGEGKVEPGLTFHGLRHTAGALLKEAGFTDEDIRTALGQKTTAMARHYSQEADTRRRMQEVAAKFDPLRRNEP